MLACKDYTKAIDVWSVGCIFAELMGRKPWLPGDDYINQLKLISQKLGKPSDADLAFVTSDKARSFMQRLPHTQRQNLAQYFPTASPAAIDLLTRMLAVAPSQRITVDEALAHPYLAALHNPADEPTAGFDFDFSFEDEHLDAVRLKELIWTEVGHFRPDCMPVPRRSGSGRK